MSDTAIIYVGKAFATVGMWFALAWLLIETGSSGGTVGWTVFFMIFATAAVWEGNVVNFR